MLRIVVGDGAKSGSAFIGANGQILGNEFVARLREPSRSVWLETRDDT